MRAASEARDQVLTGLADDIKGHLTRLELIADDCEHEQDKVDLAGMLRAEAARLRTDADRFLVWARRETTNPGASSSPGPDLGDARRSSEVYDSEASDPGSERPSS